MSGTLWMRALVSPLRRPLIHGSTLRPPPKIRDQRRTVAFRGAGTADLQGGLVRSSRAQRLAKCTSPLVEQQHLDRTAGFDT